MKTHGRNEPTDPLRELPCVVRAIAIRRFNPDNATSGRWVTAHGEEACLNHMQDALADVQQKHLTDCYNSFLPIALHIKPPGPRTPTTEQWSQVVINKTVGSYTLAGHPAKAQVFPINLAPVVPVESPKPKRGTPQSPPSPEEAFRN
jgi:hypothetical protein